MAPDRMCRSSRHKTGTVLRLTAPRQVTTTPTATRLHALAAVARQVWRRGWIWPAPSAAPIAYLQRCDSPRADGSGHGRAWTRNRCSFFHNVMGPLSTCRWMLIRTLPAASRTSKLAPRDAPPEPKTVRSAPRGDVQFSPPVIWMITRNFTLSWKNRSSPVVRFHLPLIVNLEFQSQGTIGPQPIRYQ